MMNIQRKVKLRVFLALSLYFTMVKLYTVMEFIYFISTPMIHRWLPLKGNDHSQIIIEALLLNTDKTEIPACSWSYRRQFDQVTVTQQLCHFYSYKLQVLQVWMLRYVWSLQFDHFFQQYIKRNHQDF